MIFIILLQWNLSMKLLNDSRCVWSVEVIIKFQGATFCASFSPHVYTDTVHLALILQTIFFNLQAAHFNSSY